VVPRAPRAGVESLQGRKRAGERGGGAAVAMGLERVRGGCTSCGRSISCAVIGEDAVAEQIVRFDGDALIGQNRSSLEVRNCDRASALWRRGAARNEAHAIL